MRDRITKSPRALLAVLFATLLCAAPEGAAASTDEERNAHAKTGCVRGTFKDYYLQGEGGDPPASYTGRVFKLSQNYPDRLPPQEDYPWLAVGFVDGAPDDPARYLQALLEYGLEGNIEADFYAEDNAVRDWYGMPWMDWNTEVAGDWPGTDGREFVHGLTHEFDTSGKTLSSFQGEFVDTWAGTYVNGRAGFGIGQVYCNPNSPDPAALNPVPTGFNNFADGSYTIKLLFSTIDEDQLPTMRGALEWQADGFVEVDPRYRNEGPLSRFERQVQTVRLLQVDVAVRDDRSLTGWLFGTFAYDGTLEGETPWDRLSPLGLQWGNNPKVTYSDACSGDGPCDQSVLTEQWINPVAFEKLMSEPLSLDHLGYGGRLAGPVDNPQASCMSCHQTAGFPAVAIEPAFSPLAPVVGLDGAAGHQDFQMAFFGNVPTGVVFSDSQLYSTDYSLQLSMSLQNFASVRCAPDAAEKSAICGQLTAWADAQRQAIDDLLAFGRPKAN